MSNVLAYLKAENLEELKLASFAESFDAKLKQYDDVLILERGNALSIKISQADSVRDNALKSFINVGKAYVLFPDENKVDAAFNMSSVNTGMV